MVVVIWLLHSPLGAGGRWAGTQICKGNSGTYWLHSAWLPSKLSAAWGKEPRLRVARCDIWVWLADHYEVLLVLQIICNVVMPWLAGTLLSWPSSSWRRPLLCYTGFISLSHSCASAIITCLTLLRRYLAELAKFRLAPLSAVLHLFYLSISLFRFCCYNLPHSSAQVPR
jgi:hypothetical protein